MRRGKGNDFCLPFLKLNGIKGGSVGITNKVFQGEKQKRSQMGCYRWTISVGAIDGHRAIYYSRSMPS